MSAALRQAILNHVIAHDHVSFAELLHEFGPRFNLSGDFGLGFASFPGLLCWVGMSREFCETVGELTDNGGPLVRVPCSAMVYLLDGMTLRLPVAKRARPYKSDHWVPVVIRPRAKYEAEELRKGRTTLA